MARGAALNGTLAAHDAVCRTVPGGSYGYSAGSGLVGARFSPVDGDLYQFGVAKGFSLSSLTRLHKRRTWGFDTFTGMPADEAGEATVSIWSKGRFSPVSKGGSRAKAMAALSRKVGGDVRWVGGDYRQSLTPSLAVERGMRPATYVDIDCDLYSSSIAALSWLFSQRLIAVGTVIGYDDFWDLPCAVLRGEAEATGRKPPRGTRSSAIPRHPLLTGEGKAHAEVTERYGVRFRCVCGPCGPMPRPRLLARDAWRAYFVVEAIGHPKPRAGYVLSEEDAAAFTAANALCVERRGKFETFLSNGTAR